MYLWLLGVESFVPYVMVSRKVDYFYVGGFLNHIQVEYMLKTAQRLLPSRSIKLPLISPVDDEIILTCPERK